MKTARATLFAILFACLCTSAAAQVVKCKGPGGKVIYSDVPCPDGAAGQSVNTQANVLDASGARKDVVRNKFNAEFETMMRNPPPQCQFASFKKNDEKGQLLASNAQAECVSNVLNERDGSPISERHYRLWQDHRQVEVARRQTPNVTIINRRQP